MRTLILVVLALFAGALLSAIVIGRDMRMVGTTIAELRSDPARYSGRFVEVSGRLTECFGWECSLCPEEMTPETVNPGRCLALSFRPLMPETGFGSTEQEAIFRFASVRLRTRFDDACFKGNCVDRASVLTDAVVVDVTRRRTAREGLWMHSPTPLKRAAGPSEAAVSDLLRTAGVPTSATIAAFHIQGVPHDLIGCWSSFDPDPKDWPDSEEGALYAKTINDFYNCATVKETGGRLSLQAPGVRRS